MGYIEEVHKTNFKLIRENNIQIGSVLKKGDMEEVVTNIHSSYGWILTNKWNNFTKVPQEVKKILQEGWSVHNTSF